MINNKISSINSKLENINSKLSNLGFIGKIDKDDIDVKSSEIISSNENFSSASFEIKMKDASASSNKDKEIVNSRTPPLKKKTSKELKIIEEKHNENIEINEEKTSIKFKSNNDFNTDMEFDKDQQNANPGVEIKDVRFSRVDTEEHNPEDKEVFDLVLNKVWTNKKSKLTKLI